MNNNMVEIDVGYERFLAPEMFFHPVSKFYNIFFRNLFIKIGTNQLKKYLTMQYNHVL